ncbi:hypothetical protein L1987_25068 [Smallanthus sonchifolius]|uniref:Uncharacterized protein n=1 Tax=Smallanthus sonchifolius TaxID=185202 RepID=A0ACB9IM77_9ASTR|nr:hypothetical protein L1987_25068 [Smallanthus sonchifolius]
MIISLSAKLTFSISLRFSNHNFPSEAGDLLLGDAHLVGDGDSVQLSRSNPSSSGVILHSTPFKFTSSVSLSSNFTFEIGNGVALVIIPANFPSKFAKNTSFAFLDEIRLLGIEFDANGCQISSSRVSNVTKISHVFNDGVKLTSWIDYRASLKRIDVRLSKFGDPKPVELLISYRIDLGEILKVTSVYSWSSEIKDVPKLIHSIPATPFEHSTVQAYKNKGCFVSGFIFATGCGALAALILLFVWSYVGDRRKVQGEGSVCPVDFEYEKIGVVKVNDLETAMK